MIQTAIMTMRTKKNSALSRINPIPVTDKSPDPVATGIRTATKAREAISSIIAYVMIPLAAPDKCSPSLFSETMVNETAVAVMVKPHNMAILSSPQKYCAQE